MSDINREYQRRYFAARKAEGLKRIALWVRPEDVEDISLAARCPHALSKLKKKILEDLRPKIEKQIEAELTRKTRRAMLAQKRAQARRQHAGSNRPPEMIRFRARPPGALRNRLKDAGWLYDPVAAVWHLLDDPEAWPATERLLDELDAAYDIERLVDPLG